jgi:hypothetical protein
MIASSSRTGAYVAVRQPGVHWSATKDLLVRRPGGDFVVEITDPVAGWARRHFRHKDLFEDIAGKVRSDPVMMRTSFAPALVSIVAEGSDPLSFTFGRGLPGLQVGTLLVASQCLALCEHRRYPEFEPVGGRALPARFSLGIIFDRWTWQEAARVEHSGRRGLHWLRERYSREPSFTAVLGRPLQSDACREDRDR